MKKLTVLAGSGQTQPKASQGKISPLAGPLSLIFSSTKVTASGESKTYAGVTVSMTSEDSAGYVNLSSPKLASAKYRQRRGPKPGVCPDNILNIKAESAFVQTTGKEKGPAVSQALLSTSMISCTGESNELHHNSRLQATGNLAYSHDQHPNKTGAGFERLNTEADIYRFKQRFFCVRDPRCAFIMVRRNGGAFTLAGFFCASRSTPIRLTSLFERRLVRLQNLTEEATTMATTQTRPEFIDTYWIIPEYETTPYGKVSLTRQDRRTFIALFKDSRLIWAGRQPVSSPTKYVKRMRSSKECLKDPELQKQDVKRPATIMEIVTVQGVAHV